MIESILSKLSEVSDRYIEIENLLSQPDITSNQENYIKLSKYLELLMDARGILDNHLDP